MKKCKVCRNPFTSPVPFQTWCSFDCAVVLAEKKLEAKKLKEKKEQRRKDAETRVRLKKRSELQSEAQTAFNRYIRLRDANQACICCGKDFDPTKPGGSVDAGHFRSVGSAPHLRFVEDNCHAQRKNCNRPGGTTYSKYRAGLVERIGEERVQAVEADQEPRHYSREDLINIRDTYRRKAKELEK